MLRRFAKSGGQTISVDLAPSEDALESVVIGGGTVAQCSIGAAAKVCVWVWFDCGGLSAAETAFDLDHVPGTL